VILDSTGNQGVDQLYLKIFRMCGATLLLFHLILVFSFISGCIELGSQSIHSSVAGVPDLQSEEWSGRLRMEIEPQLRSDLFSLQGDAVLTGNGTLPYLMLNATLRQGKATVVSTKYLLLDLEPDRDYSFEIAKNIKLLPGEYICILEASGPGGALASESRRCSLEEDPASFSPSALSSQGLISLSDARALFADHPQDDRSIDGSIGRARAEEEDDGQAKGAHGDKSEDDEREDEDEVDGSANKPSLGEERTELKAEVEVPAEGLGEDASKLEFPDGEDISSLPGDSVFIEGSNESEQAGEPSRYDLNQEDFASAIGEPEQRFVGSSTSKKYHLPDCRYAQKIKPENRVYFQSAKEAERQGYTPCKSCHP